MRIRNPELRMAMSAAAVALALGVTTPTVAQQSSQGESARQGQSSAQNDSSQQQRSSDSQLDRVAQMHSELGTFIEALETAGLVDELAGNTHYTIFAPTDKAFDSMQQDTAELMKPENREQLVALLRGHIVADDVDPQRARTLQSAKTLDGGTIPLSMKNDKLMIGDANVVTPNIEVQGANLRIYSIDEVLHDGRQRSASAPSGNSRG